MDEPITVYFDYLCPYAWRAAELVETISSEVEDSFEWRHFSLRQSNGVEPGDWKLWEDEIDPLDPEGRHGLLALLASLASRNQGDEAFHAFRLALLRAKHRDRRDLRMSTIEDVARESGLDRARFERDLASANVRQRLMEEHTEATAQHVFGTPTFHFSKDNAAYLRLKELPEDPDIALDLFERFRSLLADFPYLQTIKRPRP